MPNGNGPDKPQSPGSGTGTDTGTGKSLGQGKGSSSGSPGGKGSQGGVTPDNNNKPPQASIVVDAALGGPISGVVGALVGSTLHS
jgi:hypothetical protein